MLRVLIVDDEPIIRKDLESLLKPYTDFIVVGTCGSVVEAKILINATQPDLLLLDIQLSDGTGFDLLQSLEKISFHTVFITAFNEYAIKAIKYGALDYLLKPIDEPELKEALEKVKASRQEARDVKESLEVARAHLGNSENMANRSRIVLRSQYFLQVVAFDEIVYCQNDGGYTHFHLIDKRKIVVSKSIKEYDELLPRQLFLRPHQSYLVNVSFIDRFHKEGYLILKGGQEIPVSTRKKEHVISFLTGS
ncbi:LytR/AlgR family response regulator transcription factor [Taibaiella koreensis]|uniref:LytR/AlgR family response regulator transcription factor n=1 Tax=Taibaiella koreensis TaxID=1268548 RepID=UPI000E5A0DE1|nr:LytTR family DNA-binding domain-containing protein [Taibaiella koreensis]